MLRTLLLLSLGLLAACSKRALPLGNAAEDDVLLSDSPLFAHYLDTLEGADSMRVRDLYGGPLRFVGVPTPRALLESQQAGNPASAAGARSLRMLSYNVALLDANIFGLIHFTASPDLSIRAPILFQRVFDEGFDIITFQEVWRGEDVNRMLAAATEAGYSVVTSSRRGFTDGLAIAIKSSLATGAIESGSEPYSDPASSVEFFPGPGANRGYLFARFDVAGLGPVVVYDTHAEPFPNAYADRMSNVRELGLDVREHADEADLTLVGGDLNAAPYYRKNDWTLPDGTVESVWFLNTLSYPLMLHYGGLVDLAVRGRASPAAAVDDISYGDGVPDQVTDTYCAATPRVVFTGTDCNVLYREQYAGTEFPARIDYVLAKDPKNRIHVKEVSLAFVVDVPYGDKVGPLSDHYGQAVTFDVAP